MTLIFLTKENFKKYVVLKDYIVEVKCIKVIIHFNPDVRVLTTMSKYLNNKKDFDMNDKKQTGLNSHLPPDFEEQLERMIDSQGSDLAIGKELRDSINSISRESSVNRYQAGTPEGLSRVLDIIADSHHPESTQIKHEIEDKMMPQVICQCHHCERDILVGETMATLNVSKNTIHSQSKIHPIEHTIGGAWCDNCVDSLSNVLNTSNAMTQMAAAGAKAVNYIMDGGK
ncbi:hypothetical protein UF06_12510 [Vibrio sp. S234-5]|nr:hypothetical protein UF06_12510 [Vibrio sp. S234-5]